MTTDRQTTIRSSPLPAALHTDIVQAQATLSALMVAPAVPQIVRGALADRFGVARCALAGLLLLVPVSLGCALAPTIGWLIGIRALQGWGAGLATVVVPVLIRRRFDDAGSTRAMAVVAIARVDRAGARARGRRAAPVDRQLAPVVRARGGLP